jgi:hypothetical protein
VPRPLNYRLSDAVSTHAAPRNGGACISYFGGKCFDIWSLPRFAISYQRV